MSRFLAAPEGRLALITVAIFVAMSLAAPGFLSAQNVTSMAFQFPEFAILALAMTITMLTGGIDLSVVGAANLASIVAALILTGLGAGATGGDALLWLGLAMAAALAVGLAAGLFNGVAVAVFGLPPILATLGSGLIFTGIAIALTGGSAVMGFPAAAAWLGNARLLAVPVPLLLFAILAGGLAFVRTRTAFGLEVQMYGANPFAARFAAIDVTRLLIRVYAVSGVLAAIAGLVVMSRANSAKADYGSSYLLLAVLIAVLGGVNPYGGYGRVIGVVLAVLSMQFLSSGLNMLGTSNFARELIWGALLLVVMVVNAGSWPRLRARARAPEPGLEPSPGIDARADTRTETR
jgi:simple sugar transport system permease protein